MAEDLPVCLNTYNGLEYSYPKDDNISSISDP